MVKMLVLGYKEDMVHVRSTLEELAQIITIFETSRLEECLAVARREHPQIALVDRRLIRNESAGEFWDLCKFVHRSFLLSDLRCLCESPLIQIRSYASNASYLLQKAIKDSMPGSQGKGEKNGLLIIKTKSETINLNKKSIVFIESFNGKCTIHTRRRAIEVRNSLKNLEKIMGENFFRVHRSYPLHLPYVDQIRTMDAEKVFPHNLLQVFQTVSAS